LVGMLRHFYWQDTLYFVARRANLTTYIATVEHKLGSLVHGMSDKIAFNYHHALWIFLLHQMQK
jgi:hypothetical protein